MQCPPEIARILTEILSTGLLRIRALGWADASHRCAIEADHLHNLPQLLADFQPTLLDYYWNQERVSFIQKSVPANIAEFEPLWESLAEHVDSRANVFVGQKH